jgi:uncharacterized membrane protein
MRRIDLLPLSAGLLAVAGAYAAAEGAPLAVRTVLGLPLVAALPGYVLSKFIFGDRLKPAERLLLSITLTLAIDVIGGIFLTLSPWGIHTRSWAFLLGGVTFAIALASTRTRSGRASTTLRPRRALVPLALVAVTCVGVSAIAIAADRRPAHPPASASGYTLFWLVPHGKGRFEIGLESGEFQTTAYRIELRSNGQTVRRWTTGRIEPARAWQQAVQMPGGTRLDAYLFRVGHGDRPYRHVFVHQTQTP